MCNVGGRNVKVFDLECFDEGYVGTRTTTVHHPQHVLFIAYYYERSKIAFAAAQQNTEASHTSCLPPESLFSSFSCLLARHGCPPPQ